MIVLPLRMDMRLTRRPAFPVAIGMVVLYAAWMNSVTIPPWNPTQEVLHLSPLDVRFWWLAFMAMFHGGSLLAAHLILMMWLIFGRGAAEKIGTAPVAMGWLFGGIAPVFLARAGLIGFGPDYWLGLGATAGAMGVALYAVWDQDVKFFYFVTAPPWKFGAGTSETAALFLILFLHMALCYGQWHVYGKRDVIQAPPGLAPQVWVFFLPCLTWGACFMASRIRRLT